MAKVSKKAQNTNSSVVLGEGTLPIVSGCTVDIKEALLTFPTTGICEVDIDKCVKIWDNNFWNISQWKDEYSLVKVYDADNYGRCKISKQQAHELIGKLNLVDEKSPIFNSGRTWRQVV